jgi:hypothetical protein
VCGEDSTNHILVDLHVEGVRNLLSDPYAAETQIGPLHFNAPAHPHLLLSHLIVTFGGNIATACFKFQSQRNCEFATDGPKIRLRSGRSHR